MNTPICDFVESYCKQNAMRLHMPGHKGTGKTEAGDITEIPGADSLYEANGIIRESERNASFLFGSRYTAYSCEGSSLAIRAMLFLALQSAQRKGELPVIWAGRNAHRTFVSTAALLSLKVEWLPSDSLLSCPVNPDELEKMIVDSITPPTAVYVTSPDYLGGMLDIQSLAGVCHAHGIMLLVDNAHGAYLHFVQEKLHPLDQGADLCCDSAHKTLPVLTGGAYLHVGQAAPRGMEEDVKRAMALFGSTSPSYLILQSLDKANAYLAGQGVQEICKFCLDLAKLKSRLQEKGVQFYGQEPMKLTIDARAIGYTGQKLSERLAEEGIICEFADPDWTVLMFSPANGVQSLESFESAMERIPKQEPLKSETPCITRRIKRMSIREAQFARQEIIPSRESVGRVLGAVTVSCPPAVPILVSGEEITEEAVRCFRYYGLESVSVVAESRDFLPSITLRQVRKEDRKLLYALNQKYLYEMTRYYDDPFDGNGNLSYGYFDSFFTDPSRCAFFLLHEEELVGFAMINRCSMLGQSTDHVLAEFTVFPAYRRKHYALSSAQKLFDQFPGSWEIKFHERNIAASHLWQEVTSKYHPCHVRFAEEETVLLFSTEKENG